jgi:cyclin B
MIIYDIIDINALNQKKNVKKNYALINCLNYKKFSNIFLNSFSSLFSSNFIWDFFLLDLFFSIFSGDLVIKHKVFPYLYSVKNKFREFGNPLGIPENFWEVFINIKKIQKIFKINSDYMRFQSDINFKMRSILIDWLIDVHFKFKLCSKTLYLCINIVDRFMSTKSIVRQKLQLLGITSMLLASKYEELYAPETKDFVYISDNAYTKDDIFKMENLIFCSLNFQLFYPSPLTFLGYWLKLLKAKKNEILFSMYSLEITLQENYFLGHCQNSLALTSLFCSYKFLRLDFDQNMQFKFGENFDKNFFKGKDFKNSFNMISCLLLNNQNEKQKLSGTKRKYSGKKYGQISNGSFSIFF